MTKVRWERKERPKGQVTRTKTVKRKLADGASEIVTEEEKVNTWESHHSITWEGSIVNEPPETKMEKRRTVSGEVRNETGRVLKIVQVRLTSEGETRGCVNVAGLQVFDDAMKKGELRLKCGEWIWPAESSIYFRVDVVVGEHGYGAGAKMEVLAEEE